MLPGMSIVATTHPTTAEVVPFLSVQLDTPPGVDAELFASTCTATIDLLRIGGLLTRQSTVANGRDFKVRRVEYGSPLDVVFAIATSVGGLAAVALVCTKVLSELASMRVSLATARQLTAETNELRMRQARRYAQENWRAKAVIENTDRLEINFERDKTGNQRFRVRLGDGATMEFSLVELESLQLLKAEAVVLRVLGNAGSTESSMFALGEPLLSSREVCSLILLSGFYGKVEMREPDKEN